LPERPEFEFLRTKHFRIKTIRLRQQISQGIIFPLDLLPVNQEWTEGQDVSDALGIVKYEPPVPAQLAGKIKGLFPQFLVKSDQTRIQSVPSVLVRHKGLRCFVTEKRDGSSFTSFLRGEQDPNTNGMTMLRRFGVCSRNLELKEEEGNAYWQVARKYQVEEKLRSIGRNLAIQGEILGPGIQGNKLQLPSVQLEVFDFFNIDTFSYVGYEEYCQLIKELDLPSVPILDDNFVLDHTVDSLVEYATRKTVTSNKIWAEGVVIKPLTSMRDEDLGRFSFKVINPEFLLEHKE